MGHRLCEIVHMGKARKTKNEEPEGKAASSVDASLIATIGSVGCSGG